MSPNHFTILIADLESSLNEMKEMMRVSKGKN